MACPVASADFLTALSAFPLLSSECFMLGAGPSSDVRLVNVSQSVACLLSPSVLGIEPRDSCVC